MNEYLIKTFSEHMTYEKSLKRISEYEYVTPDDRIKIEGEYDGPISLSWASDGSEISRDIDAPIMGIRDKPFNYEQTRYMMAHIAEKYRPDFYVGVYFDWFIDEEKNGRKPGIEDAIYHFYPEELSKGGGAAQLGRVPIDEFDDYKYAIEATMKRECAMIVYFDTMEYMLAAKYLFMKGGFTEGIACPYKEFQSEDEVVEYFCRKCLKLPMFFKNLDDIRVKRFEDEADNFRKHGIIVIYEKKYKRGECIYLFPEDYETKNKLSAWFERWKARKKHYISPYA